MLYLLLFEKRKRRKKYKERKGQGSFLIFFSSLSFYKERKGQGSFSQGRHAVLAVPHWDFPDC
jgi:hypothetical protein